MDERLKTKQLADKFRARARRLVEQQLGRNLDRFEYVHHKDHNPFNNDLTNLEVMAAGDHTRLHMRGPYWDVPRWLRPGVKEKKLQAHYKKVKGWQPCHEPADTKNCMKCYRREQKRRLVGHQPKNIHRLEAVSNEKVSSR